LDVIPAKAGIQLRAVTARTESWTPAFAGVTAKGDVQWESFYDHEPAAKH
jgi:hypothetical protein